MAGVTRPALATTVRQLITDHQLPRIDFVIVVV